MKILYLVTKSNWGGAQKYVYDLATTFATRGHKTEVGTGGTGELISRLQAENIPVHVLSSLKRDIGIISELKSLYEIYALIRNIRPDILHLNSSKASGIGSVCGRLLGVKCIVVTMHGAPFREDRRWVIRRLIYFFTWLTCLFAHKVITVSLQDEQDLARMYFVRQKVRTIYNGIAYESVPPRTAPKGRETHILTVAELHRNKGLLYGLRAIENLHKNNHLVHYTIFGEGDERKELEKYITMKGLGHVVTLRGHDSKLHDEWGNYDLFLLPSIKEGLPYVLIEAGRAMLPVVTTTTGGIPEIVRHEETGLLVRPKDDAALTKELERLVKDRKFAKTLGQTLHSHVVQHFSFSKMIVETAKVYGLMEKAAIK